MLSSYFMRCSIVSLYLRAIFILQVLASSLVFAEVDTKNPLLHPLFSDHAVLQRDVKVPVWGWAHSGVKIVVRFADQEKQTVTNPDGQWMVYLDPMKTSSVGRTLRVIAATSSLQISDVLVGDVWLCSGQSNMEMGVGLCNIPEEIAKADFPLVRLLTVPHRISYTPETTVDSNWLPCNPQSLMQGKWGGFSATAYFFGKKLHRELNVPIGLIHSSWGGTKCEAWTSRDALEPLKIYQADLDLVNEVASLSAADPIGEVMKKWYSTHDPGTRNEWHLPKTDSSKWSLVKMPAGYAACGLKGYEGIVWAQFAFNAPKSWVGKKLIINLGTVSDVDTTWMNGHFIGKNYYFDVSRTYSVPADVISAGKNVIAMRIINVGGGGFSGKPDEMKIFPEGDEAAAISLAAEWRMKDTAASSITGPAPVGRASVATVLYNGMIAPLIPFAMKGAAWYQGEANASQAAQYSSLLTAMIQDWRFRFAAGDFGFHIVSLANYQKSSPVPVDHSWAKLREAQAAVAQSLPHCGIAMAIDIGDANDIHPTHKQEVGRRLALSALALTYGKPIEWSGPWYQMMKKIDGGIRLTFEHAQSGLVVKGDKLTGFAIAGNDRKFVWADARVDGKSVIVSSPEVPNPVAVRYAWDANPHANLYNGEDLPAVPFRTDKW